MERVSVFSDFAATFHNISSECINDEHCIRFSLVLVDRPSTVVFSESRSVSTLFFRDSVSMETSEFAFSFSCSSCRVTDYQLFIRAVNVTPLSNDRYSVLYAFLFLASLDYRQENRIGFVGGCCHKCGAGFNSRQGVYECPVPRPTPNYGTKCPRRIATLTKKQTDFLFKIEMGGKPF